jgi:CO/xanthine dehydrogenase Mo-binding subunit
LGLLCRRRRQFDSWRRKSQGRVASNLLQDCGAYLQLLTPTIAHLTVFMAPGAYDLPRVDSKLDEVFTNPTPTDAFRGAGRPEATHLVERLVDAPADELAVDAAELRRLGDCAAVYSRRGAASAWPVVCSIGGNGTGFSQSQPKSSRRDAWDEPSA